MAVKGRRHRGVRRVRGEGMDGVGRTPGPWRKRPSYSRCRVTESPATPHSNGMAAPLSSESPEVRQQKPPKHVCFLASPLPLSALCTTFTDAAAFFCINKARVETVLASTQEVCEGISKIARVLALEIRARQSIILQESTAIVT